MAVQVAEYGNLENFLAAEVLLYETCQFGTCKMPSYPTTHFVFEVLPLGQEAEGTMLIAAATQLKASDLQLSALL
eukprot:4793382-Amphidinium_carterae.1